MRIIFVEGCDGVGKSSLVKQLTDALAFDFISGYNGSCRHKFNYPKSMYDYVAAHCQVLEARRTGIYQHYGQSYRLVCDRSHISHLAYADFREDKRPVNDLFIAIHHEYCKLFSSVVVVHVDGEIDVVADRVAARGDALVSKRDIAGLMQTYRELFTFSDSVFHIANETASSKAKLIRVDNTEFNALPEILKAL